MKIYASESNESSLSNCREQLNLFKTGKRDLTKVSEKVTFAKNLMGLMLTKGGFARFGYLLG